MGATGSDARLPSRSLPRAYAMPLREPLLIRTRLCPPVTLPRVLRASAAQRGSRSKPRCLRRSRVSPPPPAIGYAHCSRGTDETDRRSLRQKYSAKPAATEQSLRSSSASSPVPPGSAGASGIAPV